ncbi:MAG: aldo/keto reductase [Dactylosporangium sp.]|nr:aldo/keto reductase [Dactylosporangium sp.]NNJ61276.1 aldo/keto reductase [Dactylosporangium sp.]
MRRTRLGRSAVTVTALGLGGASIGNLYRAVSDADADAVIEAAWAAGVRYFDTAPHYGLGLSERRLGARLRGLPRDEYVLSTKVGRLLVPDPAGADRRDRDGFDVPATTRRAWDFSADGVRRSLDDSLRRLGLDRVDLALIHDPEEGDPVAALAEAYPALHELRDWGVVGAIGVGSKRWQTLARFVAETDIDAVMLAGRYTLLEQPALAELLPACATRGVSVINVGVFNSGLLAVEHPDAEQHYEYGQAPDRLVRRAQRIAEVCRRHRTTLPAAALAFSGAHPAVASIVLGSGRAAHLRRNAELLALPPPPGLWQDLVDHELLSPTAPTPGVNS